MLHRNMYTIFLTSRQAVSAQRRTSEIKRFSTTLKRKTEERVFFRWDALDKDTEGFLLITDDGPLAHELLSPKKHVDKTYYAKVSGKVTEEDVVQGWQKAWISGKRISHDRQGWRSFLPGSPAQNLQKPVRTGNLRSDLPSTRENSIR